MEFAFCIFFVFICVLSFFSFIFCVAYFEGPTLRVLNLVLRLRFSARFFSRKIFF